MFPSCLTYFVVPPSFPVGLPAVSSISLLPPLLACLVPPRSISPRLVPLLASLLVGRGGLAIGVGSVCDYGGRADVVRLLAPRFACVPFSSRPAPSTRLAGRGTGAVVVGFLRISAVYRPR